MLSPIKKRRTSEVAAALAAPTNVYVHPSLLKCSGEDAPSWSAELTDDARQRAPPRAFLESRQVLQDITAQVLLLDRERTNARGLPAFADDSLAGILAAEHSYVDCGPNENVLGEVPSSPRAASPSEPGYPSSRSGRTRSPAKRQLASPSTERPAAVRRLR